MRNNFHPGMNEWRLREGPLATDDDAYFEGVFIIPSASAAKGAGHPFDYHTVFQLRVSEVGEALDGTTWEHVSCIVKSEIRGHLTQRRPHTKEAQWIHMLIWGENETSADFYGNPRAKDKIDHRIMHLMRPEQGWPTLPELFREEIGTSSAKGDPDFHHQGNIIDLTRSKQANAVAKEREKIEAGRARVIYDVKRILQGADQDSLEASMGGVQFTQLKSILELE